MIDFDSMIDNHLKRESRPKGAGRYYPSEIGTCLRKIWYSYIYPQETGAELMKIFQLGNMMHDFVVDVLRSEKNPDVQLLKSEFPLRFDVDDFVVSGRVDNLILVKASGKEFLVEVKSAGSVEYITEAKPHNIMQLQLYMHVTGIKSGLLLYLDKRNLKSKIYEVKYDEKEAMKIVERFRELHKHLKEKKLPLPEARGSKENLWMCRYCEYHDRCYAATPSSRIWL